MYRRLILCVVLILASVGLAKAQTTTAITQTVFTLAANTDLPVVATNRQRKYLCVMNIGTGLVTLGFDLSAVAGSGWALEGASVQGHQGGSQCWEGDGVPGAVVHAISAAGSTLVVLEGK